MEPDLATMNAKLMVPLLGSSKELSAVRMGKLEKCDIEGRAGSSREMGWEGYR